MFPKNIKFTSTPSRLQQAVDSLPEPKGKIRRTVSKDNALRAKLLQIETDQLRKWKLKPAMLKLIPTLARERSNAELQEKVLAVATTSLENMDVHLLSEMVSLFWHHEEFRLALNAHCVRYPPSGKGWFPMYYKAFRSEHPPKEIARQLEPSLKLYALHKHLGMQTSNPLFEAICIEFTKSLTHAHVSNWNWGDLIAFLRSGYPLQVRQHIFESTLVEYIGPQVSFTEVQESTELQTLLEIKLLSKRQEKVLPAHIQTLLHQSHTLEQLSQWLSSNDLFGWTPFLSEIEHILVHRASGWLCVVFQNCALIWPMSQRENQMYVISIKEFRQRLQSKLRQPIPIALHPDCIRYSVEKNEAWSDKLANWLAASNVNEQGEQ